MKLYRITYSPTDKVGYYAENSKTLIKIRNRKILFRKYENRIHDIRDALLPKFISEYEEGKGYWYYGFKATSKSGGSLEMCRELDRLNNYIELKLNTWKSIKDINKVKIAEVGILED